MRSPTAASACSRSDAAICLLFPVVFQDTHEIGGHVKTVDLVVENAVCCTQIHIYLCHTSHEVASVRHRDVSTLSCITHDTRRSVYKHIYPLLHSTVHVQ